MIEATESKRNVYECGSCGIQYKALKAEWVVRADVGEQRVLWRCPNCGRLQKDVLHVEPFE